MQDCDSSGIDQRFQVRRLELLDKRKGFIELLQQLTVCDSVTDKDFEDRFKELSSLGDDHVIAVIEDEQSGMIVATGSVFIEKKFIRNCGKVAHIEDVVVDANTRGKQLGKKIVGFLTDHACSTGCYKIFEILINLHKGMKHMDICPTQIHKETEHPSKGFIKLNIDVVLDPLLLKFGVRVALRDDFDWVIGSFVVSLSLTPQSHVAKVLAMRQGLLMSI
uniref:Glucosamine 6-phosphate N-acetyltransferase n=1 Tax=Cannabis sativa TaxID=3483 RepID=A0A803P636_CANSA